MANVTVNGITYTVEAGTKLGDLLAREQHMSMPCGGHGRCGKCRVAAAGELSDYSDRERDFLSEKSSGKVCVWHAALWWRETAPCSWPGRMPARFA